MTTILLEILVVLAVKQQTIAVINDSLMPPTTERAATATTKMEMKTVGKSLKAVANNNDGEQEEEKVD